MDTYSTLDTIRAMPKIELHRHLEGSWRLETLCAIAHEYCLPIAAYDVETMRPYVQIMPNEPRTSDQFLSKFRFLRQFFRSETIIRRVTREAIADAAADNIKYMELRFTPQALNNLMHCDYNEVVSWVCSAAQAAASEHNILVRLIISMNRHEAVKIGEAVLEAALAHRDHGVVGIDLAGQEAEFSGVPFQPVFERAKAEGLGITAHAGEWAGVESIREVIDRLGVERIGHGTRAVEDASLVAQLAERGIVFEVCPSSNVDSGVIAALTNHPLPHFIDHGAQITLNTDDPLISQITLSDEISRAMEAFSLSLDDIKRQQIAAANAVFLPPDQRAALVSQFQNWLFS